MHTFKLLECKEGTYHDAGCGYPEEEAPGARTGRPGAGGPM